MKKIGYFCLGFAVLTGFLRADQNLAGNVTITGGAAAGKLNVTGALNVVGAIDSDSNTVTFGTQATSYGAALLYIDNAVDTLSFSINRSPASWLFVHNTNIAAMRLDSAHQLILYRSDGATAGLTFTPQASVIKLGTNSSATLTGNDTSGLISAGGPFTVSGAFTATSGITNTSGAFGGPAALNFTAGGTNQNITLTPSGTGYTILNGNVGIGVAAPAAKLDVLGTTKFLASTGFYGTRIGSTAGGDSFVWLGSRVGVPVIQGNNQAFGSVLPLALQAEGGNVGIGTTTPTTPLDILKSSSDAFQIKTADSNPSRLDLGNTGSLWYMTATRTGSGSFLPLTFWTGDNERVRVDTAGNVGIGTSSPAGLGKLAVAGTITTASPDLGHVEYMTIDSSGHGVLSAYSGTGAYLGFVTTNSSGLATEQMRIDSVGNIGIGTSAPAAKLHIQKDAAVATDYSLSQLFVGGTDGNKRMAIAYDTTNNVGLVQAYINGGAVQNISLQSAGGNVGIGTTAPVSKLQLTGENVELSMGRTNIDTTAYTRFGMTTGYDTYWSSNASYSTGAWNYINTSGWGSQATRIDQINGTISLDTANGGVNPLVWNTRVFVGNNGNVGIGTTNPGSYKLAVLGSVHATAVVVETGWSDYVFDKDYRLAPLSEVEAHIKEHNHLPGIPSAAEVAEHGVSLGDMQSKLLAKIEELTLRQIAQEKQLNAQASRISQLEQENHKLRATQP